jgi:hypothetical protein
MSGTSPDLIRGGHFLGGKRQETVELSFPFNEWWTSSSAHISLQVLEIVEHSLQQQHNERQHETYTRKE